jgi:deoxyribodipyrimidine photo-lyase
MPTAQRTMATGNGVPRLGTDAMQDYRGFQSSHANQEFDAKGEHILRYVPELTKVPDRYSLTYTITVEDLERSSCWIGLDYPTPIVDYQRVR